MSNEIVAAVVGEAIGVAGAGIGAYFAVFFQQRIAAGLRLREAFRDELVILKDFGNGTNPEPLLNNAFYKHHAAIIEFRHSINAVSRQGFDSAWNMYHRCYEDSEDKFFTQYSVHLGGIKLAEKNRALAISRIEHILSFTKS